ncbi:MAG: winged helix-turn-helix transcriptional regulator [Candidatus Heimdallarchaeota archaeon]|nr:MAG: winged helix-turn-helix transcriptional regulator [Candidatus Heimdallarchaeota archaeon]
MVEPCKTIEIHPEQIAYARKKIDESNPTKLTKFFRMVSGETRIRILLALLETELCVCDLSEILGLSPSAISHQLKELREGNFVKFRREGKENYYSLEIEHLEPILENALEHLKVHPVGGE